jgi:hypothetical protein
MKKNIEETKGLLAEAYIEFFHKVKAKSNRLQKERTEMEQMFKDFANKHEAAGRAVFRKSLEFYLDSLNKSEFEKVLAVLDDEIHALKRDIDESTKIEVESIK